MISIIIVTHNRVNLVQQCIEGIIAQSRSKHEIIVVDNYSSDNTTGVLKNRYNNRLKIIKTDSKKSLVSCKNIGIHEAQGDIIAFTDDDCVPSPDWPDRIIACFESDGCDIAAGPVRLLNKLHFPRWWRPSLNWTIGIAEINSKNFLPLGSNVAFKKDALINIESESNTMPYEEIVYTEDNSRIFAAIKKGYKIKLDGAIIVYHNITQERISFNYLIRRSWLEGKHWAKNKKDIKILACRLAAFIVNPFRFAISMDLNHILKTIVSLSYIIECVKSKNHVFAKKVPMIEIADGKKRLLLKIIDNIITLLHAALSPILYMNSKKTISINKILLIRLDHIGDVAMITHTPKLIKERYPGAKITMMIGSWALDVLKNNPYIDEIICHDAPSWASIKPRQQDKTLLKYIINDYIPLLKKLRKERFDIGVDFRGDIRHIILFLLLPRIKCRLSYDRAGGGCLLSQSSAYDKKLHEMHKATKLLNVIGIESRPVRPDIYITNDERTAIDKIFKINSIKENDIKIILSPGARLEIKRWPIGNFIKLGKLLEKKYGAWIVFTGISPEINKKDIPLYDKFVNLVDDLSLLQLTALFEKSNLLISNDSGAAHIASSRDIPIIALFGPTDPDIYKPVSNNIIVIKAPGGYMGDIAIEEVAAAAERFL